MIRALVVFPLIVSFATTPQVANESSPAEKIVFEGLVERISPDSGILSGNVAVYRLAKYRVKRICKGRYQGKRIVVDHLILTGKELEGIKVGDQVCVLAQKSNKILARFNANGIRRPSDRVKTFYVAGIVEAGSIESFKSCDC